MKVYFINNVYEFLYRILLCNDVCIKSWKTTIIEIPMGYKINTRTDEWLYLIKQ